MATKKKSKQKKAVRKPSPAKRIARQTSIPGMEDTRISAIETAALDYAEKRDERQALTAEESSLKQELLHLMHKEGKTEYKRGNISITVVTEKENVKVRVRDDAEADESEAAEESMAVAV